MDGYVGKVGSKVIERHLMALRARNDIGPVEEQAIRAQFMQLNEKLIKNKNLAKTFTPEERAAIVKVVKGGPLGNALRKLGKSIFRNEVLDAVRHRKVEP